MTSVSTPCGSQLLGVAVKQMQNFPFINYANAFGSPKIILSDSSTKINEFASG
jgi:hypothetical protein